MAEQSHYTPKPGSVPWRVLSFLKANPDEELSRGDIALKFDVPPASVEGFLASAIAHECLKRKRNDEMMVVWCLGANPRFTIEPEGSDPEQVQPARVAHAAANPMRLTDRPPLPPPHLDLDSVTIRKGIRLLTPEERRRKEFADWFDQFEIGDSAEFDEKHTPTIKTESNRHKKANQSQWKIAETGPGRFGIERVA